MKNTFVATALLFVVLMSTTMASEEDSDRASFEHVDLNKDGFVTAEEAHVVSISQQTFDAADGDQDGKLDQTEYSVAASEVK